MTPIKTMAALAASLAFAASAHAATTYSFSGFFGQPSPSGDFTATFSITVPSLITADTVIDASGMTQCQTPVGACTSVGFYVDAAAAGFAPEHPEWEAIAFSNDQGTSYYYFDGTTFTTDGVHSDVFGIGPATLDVRTAAVPEPASMSLLLAGLGLMGVAARRRAAR